METKTIDAAGKGFQLRKLAVRELEIEDSMSDVSLFIRWLTICLSHMVWVILRRRYGRLRSSYSEKLTCNKWLSFTYLPHIFYHKYVLFEQQDIATIQRRISFVVMRMAHNTSGEAVSQSTRYARCLI